MLEHRISMLVLEIQKWFADLPSFLRLTPGNLLKFCPPLHIVSLNLLYHTTVRLLHRPFIIGATDLQSSSASESYQICVIAARESEPYVT
jgi:hypothetical protein